MANDTMDPSTGELMQHVIRDVGDMVRAEIRLAHTELIEKGKKAEEACWLLTGAGMAGLTALACLVTAGIAGLSLIMPMWLAALSMTVLMAAAGVALYASGRAKLNRISPVPQKMVESVKENLQWAKQQIK